MRVAVVTGASSGIGAELCRAARGARLARRRALAPAGAGRARARGVRRLRPRRRRRRRRARARAASAHRPARQQRRHRKGPRGVRRRRPRPRSRRTCARTTSARSGASTRSCPGLGAGLARRQHRLGRGHGRLRPVLGDEARAARVLAHGRDRARAARHLACTRSTPASSRRPASRRRTASRSRSTSVLVVGPPLVVERTLARDRVRPARDRRAALVRARRVGAGARSRRRRARARRGCRTSESTTTRRARLGPALDPRGELVGDRAGDARVLLERQAGADERDRRAARAARGRARPRRRPSRSSRRRGARSPSTSTSVPVRSRRKPSA